MKILKIEYMLVYLFYGIKNNFNCGSYYIQMGKNNIIISLVYRSIDASLFLFHFYFSFFNIKK